MSLFTNDYLYILKQQKFIEKNIFKIGIISRDNSTTNDSYPQGSILMFETICFDSIEVLQKIFKEFKTRFIYRNDIGSDYFEGDFQHMRLLIFKFVNEKQIEEKKIEEKDGHCKFCSHIFHNQCSIPHIKNNIKFHLIE